ncbi:hypothetical protein [Sphaerisporangium rhizosphaerae]|uniref:Uncharacterized protein n=1 Tax=Sphaerisporangium rhizosphaerae TaxID=2269375 RepID=A0ABW2NVP3_9ACTN
MHQRWLKLAELAGAVIRNARGALPGLAGATCVSVGLGMVFPPLGVIAAGVFLLIIDYRRP